MRRAQLRGRGPSSSTRLHERTYSQSEWPPALYGPWREAPRAVESRRLRRRAPLRGRGPSSSTRQQETALLTERAGARCPRAVERLRATRPARRPSDDAA